MTTIFGRVRALCRSNAGSSAVEFAIAAPILIALMFAVIEFGRAWWTKNSLQYAVERAARFAVVCNNKACPTDSQIQNYAMTQVYDQTVAVSAFTVSHPAGATCINYNFNYAPWFAGQLAVMSSSMAMTGASCRAHP